MIKFRQIIQNFAHSGELSNTTVIEWIDEKHQGDARNATAEDMTLIGDAAAAGYLAQIEALNVEIAALKNPESPSPAANSSLSAISEVFGQLPIEIQSAFAVSFAIVRTLVQAGRSDLAAAHVAALVIPEELEGVRGDILALLE